MPFTIGLESGGVITCKIPLARAALPSISMSHVAVDPVHANAHKSTMVGINHYLGHQWFAQLAQLEQPTCHFQYIQFVRCLFLDWV